MAPATVYDHAAERAAYLKKGSARPLPGRCGSHLAKRHLGPLRESTPWRYCAQRPLTGQKKCKKHWGGGHTGAANPNWRDGNRSQTSPFQVGSALARGYERLTSDRDYLTCRVQMKLLGARQEELVERIAAGDGESAGGWRQVVALVASADAAMRVSPATPESARALSEAVRELLGQTRGRAGREEAFVELREIAGIWGRLSETEGRLAERNRAMLGVEQYLSMATAIGQLASRCIVMEAPADVRLREFVKGMGALTGGVRLTQPLLTAGMPA